MEWSIQSADKLAAERLAYDVPLPAEDINLFVSEDEPVSVEPNKVWDHSGNDRHLTMSGFEFGMESGTL